MPHTAKRAPLAARDAKVTGASSPSLPLGAPMSEAFVGDNSGLPVVARIACAPSSLSAPAKNAPWAAHIASLYPNGVAIRSEEPTSELQSLIRTSYSVFCL